ncbi:unnamed protein product [Anisakis simplex]|uniref:Uncharacterized protein n=1 Tax=Anisakis simplex TaxID=6269 RepID=A0A3P6PDR2_ANISI|nr:unnamed protein product [Anisakis simplex]
MGSAGFGLTSIGFGTSSRGRFGDDEDGVDTD